MRFSDCFWDEDINSSNGFDMLCKRLKEGRQEAKEFTDFIKSWAQAEEHYGKTLMKLSKLVPQKEDTSNLQEEWMFMKSKIEAIGSMHVTVANEFLEEVGSITDLVESQKEQRKKVEDAVKKTHSRKKTAFKKSIEQKKNYHSKCKEFEMNVQVCQESSSDLSTKETEKMQIKCSKAKTQSLLAEEQYKSAVESVNDIRRVWEKEMEAACEVFQELEESRLKNLRNKFWIVTNLGSKLCNGIEEAYEEIRNHIETYSLENDIETFISRNKTGSIKPEPILYEPFEFKSKQNKSRNDETAQFSDSFSDFDEVSNYEDVMINEIYESRDDVSCYQKYTVKYGFDGESESELSLETGTIVTVISRENDEWWGIETDDGRQGYFPANYLNPIK